MCENMIKYLNHFNAATLCFPVEFCLEKKEKVNKEIL